MMNRSILLLLIFIAGCSVTQRDDNLIFDETTVSEIRPIISAETHPEIASPAFIRTVPDGFLVYDFGTQKVHKYDLNGNHQFNFGQEGQGPGEFQTVTKIWDFGDSYMLYDYRGAKLIRYSTEGTFLDEIAIEERGFSVALEAVSSYQYYVPSNGKEGSLLQYIDMEIDTVQQFGQALGKEVETVDLNQARQAISANRIPAFMKNQVFLSSNASGVYVFQQTTALLQNYNHNGELVWEEDLQIPAVDGVFEQFLETNKTMMERGRIIMLSYAHHIETTENGVAILLNTLEDKPVTVVWLSNDGEKGSIITYPSFEHKPQIFSISSHKPSVYFTNTLEGEIYQAHWPVK